MVAALPPVPACVLFAVAVRNPGSICSGVPGFSRMMPNVHLPPAFFRWVSGKITPRTLSGSTSQRFCGSRANFSDVRCGGRTRPCIARMRDARVKKSCCFLPPPSCVFAIFRIPTCFGRRQTGWDAFVPPSDEIGRGDSPPLPPCHAREDGKNRAFYLPSANIVRSLDFNAGKVTFMPAL